MRQALRAAEASDKQGTEGDARRSLHSAMVARQTTGDDAAARMLRIKLDELSTQAERC